MSTTASHDSRKVLLVENHADDLRWVREVLGEMSSDSFDLITVKGHTEAVERLAGETIDVILLALSLPDAEGLEILTRMRAAVPHLPIVVVTDGSDETCGLQAVRAGAQDYLLKDHLDSRLLKRVLRNALERKQADQAQRESERRYRSLFENMLNGFAYCKMEFDQGRPQDFLYLEVNAAFETLTGLENVVGKYVSEVIPGIQVSDPELFASYGRVAWTGQPETLEIYVTSLALWFSIAIYSPQREYFVAIFEVITERKRAEEELTRYRDHLEQLVGERTTELNRAKTRLEAILNNATDGIVLASPQRGIGQSNSMFNRLFTCEPDGYFGQPLLSLVHPEDRDRLAARIQAVLADGVGRHDEYRALRADKTCFEARIGIGSTQAEDILNTGLVCSIQDISELKQREHLLRYHASLQETVSDAVIASDLQFRIQSWNGAAERIYGWRAGEVLGKSIGEVLPTEFASDETSQRVQREFQEKGYWSDEVVQFNKQGRALHILSSTVLFKDENGQPLGMVAVNHDITARKEAELLLLAKTQEESELQTYLKALHEISLNLTQLDSLDAFYQHVVEQGRSRLGFDRLALFLYDVQTGSAQGTYGTDEHGQVCDERGLRFTPNPEGIMMRAFGRAARFCLDAPAPLYKDTEQIGVGWNAAAALWNGTQMVGWLVADNLIGQTTASKALLEIFSLYALTVGTLLGQKQAITALRESEAKFRSFVEAAPEAIVISNHRGTITLVNAEAERVFGYPRDELIGQAVELLVPEAQREAHRGHRVRDAAAPYRRSLDGLSELPGRRKDGSLFPAEIQLSAVRTQNDLHVISFVADVTERNHAEEVLRQSEVRLRESQQMLHNVLETMPVRVFWKDRESTFLGGNHLYAQDAGFTSSEQIVGKSDFDLPSREHATEYRADDQAVMDSGLPKTQIEEQVTLADGSTVWIQTNKSPLRDSNGEVSGVIGAYIEISKRKQAEEALQRALVQQKDLVDLKARFISMASHDFRTPMSVILSSSSLLEMQIARQFGADQVEPLRKRLGRIDEAVQHMVSLLDDVLLVNRADSGKLEVHPERLDVESFCNDLLKEIQLTVSAQHVLVFSFAGEEREVVADKQVLRQILVNLLSNAVKYSPSGGKVTLDVRRGQDRLEIRVQDEGIGIPEPDQARLFETFHRAHNVGDIQGTGLGMAIVKRAVDALAGTIGFESQVGVGTTFVVRLPAAFGTD